MPIFGTRLWKILKKYKNLIYLIADYDKMIIFASDLIFVYMKQFFCVALDLDECKVLLDDLTLKKEPFFSQNSDFHFAVITELRKNLKNFIYENETFEM